MVRGVVVSEPVHVRSGDLLRIALAAYLPARCAWCGKAYASVEDLMERDPRIGLGWKMPGNSERIADHLVDAACWAAHVRWNEDSA